MLQRRLQRLTCSCDSYGPWYQTERTSITSSSSWLPWEKCIASGLEVGNIKKLFFCCCYMFSEEERSNVRKTRIIIPHRVATCSLVPQDIKVSAALLPVPHCREAEVLIAWGARLLRQRLWKAAQCGSQSLILNTNCYPSRILLTQGVVRREEGVEQKGGSSPRSIVGFKG